MLHSICDVVMLLLTFNQFNFSKTLRRLSIVLTNNRIIEMACRYAIQKIIIVCFLLYCVFCGKTLCRRDVEYKDTGYYEYESSNERPTYQIQQGMYKL